MVFVTEFRSQGQRKGVDICPSYWQGNNSNAIEESSGMGFERQLASF